VLLVWGYFQPAYLDADLAARAIVEACDDNGKVIGDWYARMDGLRTTKYLLMDIGAGLLLAGITSWLMMRILCISLLRDLLESPSPHRRWHFLALGIGTLFWAWQASIGAVVLGLVRNTIPGAPTPSGFRSSA